MTLTTTTAASSGSRPSTTSKGSDEEDAARSNKLYEQYMTMVNTLPEGWRRNSQEGQAAPFVHVPSGTVSWKHPNQAQLKAFVKEQELRQRQAAMLGEPVEYYYQMPTATKKTTATTHVTINNIHKKKRAQRMVKMLQLMLQSGAPLEAVERRAAVEQIDMAVVLQQQPEQEQDSAAEDDDSKSTTEKKIVVSPVLLKKYSKYMRGSAISVGQV
jgi:hypothetical protein